MKLLRNILKILLCTVVSLTAIFLIGRYGWKLFGFSAYQSAGIETVEVTDDQVKMTNTMDPADYVQMELTLLGMSVLCGFFGGGDMNGIKLLFPEIAVRIVSAVIGVIHGIVIWKYLLPFYTKSFQKDNIHGE